HPGRGGVTMDCSEADLMLDELALDVLPGDRRAALLAHVEECPNCRRLLDQLTETADDLLLAGPAAAPPTGFEERVLARIAAGSPAGRSGQRRRDRAALRLSAWTAAAAAVVLLVIGGATGAVIGRSGSGESAEQLRTVQLISTRGADIGDVSMYTGDPSSWFFMRVESDNLPDATYRCVLDMDDGSTVAIGRLWAVKGHGGWGEHLSVDPGHALAARLLDPSGATVGTARLR
ncbi:MAG: zf-HC2 domain-containing protein, partial [Actinobacteria bacterium]|nr:zf-HC2 domain-containing protein [Actinomycetota bacterium]